jgi:hypothetical protein
MRCIIYIILNDLSALVATSKLLNIEGGKADALQIFFLHSHELLLKKITPGFTSQLI